MRIPLYIIIGIILLVALGSVVTKTTVYDQVGLDDVGQECRANNYWDLRDTPLEQVGIRLLGKSSVVSSTLPTADVRRLRVQAYTLFRIPVGQSILNCPHGSSYRIPQTEAGIKGAIEKANYCTAKSDCVQVKTQCPFGCSTFVNKDEAQRIQTMVDSYESKCVYSCVQLKGFDCVDNKCQVQY